MSKVNISIILKKDGKTCLSTYATNKTRILKVVRSDKNTEWNSGYVRVTYDKTLEYYNHAFFETVSELKKHLSVADMLDPYLLETFCA